MMLTGWCHLAATHNVLRLHLALKGGTRASFVVSAVAVDAGQLRLPSMAVEYNILLVQMAQGGARQFASVRRIVQLFQKLKCKLLMYCWQSNLRGS